MRNNRSDNEHGAERGEGSNSSDGSHRANTTPTTRSFLEFIGAHPLSTGILALLGIVGFFVSVLGFLIDRQDASQTTEQVTEVETVVSEILRNVASNCDSPPCLQLHDIGSSDFLGRTKDFVERKAPPPIERWGDAYVYEIQNCRVALTFSYDVVSLVEVDLYVDPYPQNTRYNSEFCILDYEKILRKKSKSIYDPETEGRNILSRPLVLSDIYNLGYDYVFTDEGCLSCGNSTDPYLSLYTEGPRATGFLKTYVKVEYAGLGHNGWIRLHDQLNAEFNGSGELWALELDNKNLAPVLGSLPPIPIASIGFSR